jgi:hypothetical protein
MSNLLKANAIPHIRTSEAIDARYSITRGSSLRLGQRKRYADHVSSMPEHNRLRRCMIGWMASWRSS